MKIGSHAQRLLQAVGEPASDQLKGPLLSDFDWESRGVSHPYLIFMTGRCGSTWLTSILRDTKLAGNPGEFFNESVAKRECRGTSGLYEYLNFLVQREASHGRFGIEVDSGRLRQVERLIDWPSVFPNNSCRTFFLYRSNLAAQAWSWVSARKSGLWHVRSNSKMAAPSVSDALPTEIELTQEMVRIRRDEEYLQEFFNRYGYQPYYLDYESLVTELDIEIRAILRILSVSYEDISTAQIEAGNKAVNKITYTEKNRNLAEFTRKHAHAISALRCRRFQINPEELSELLVS